MIVFDLCCGVGHVFEAWFASSAAYESQRGRGLVRCPVCDDASVDKAVMAPSIGTKGNRGDAAPAEAKAALRALAALQAKALETSRWVGDRFADEARAMHAGEADAGAIHGRTSRDEARALAEEGVPIAPLPLPVVPPDRSN